MKKKITSLIMIVAMLLLPFSMLLTVHATNVTNDPSGVIYDDATTKSGDSSSYLVTGTADIIVSGVNVNAAGTDYDTFKAYKVVNTYYNPTTNQFSYAFTSAFATFVSTLTTADIRAITGDNTATTFTIDDYMDSTKVTSDSSGDNISTTASTLNILVSKFATYIRTHAGTANAVTGITMTNGEYTGSTHDDNIPDNNDAKADDVEAGSYLILPDAILTKAFINDSFQSTLSFTYGVMIGNVSYEVVNNAWVLNDCTVSVKSDGNLSQSQVWPWSVTECADTYSQIMAGTISQDVMTRYMSSLGTSTTANSGLKIGGTFVDTDSDIPVNIHSSITSDIINMTKYTQVSLPTGFSFDYSDVAGGQFAQVTKIGNNYYTYGTETANANNLMAEPVNSTTLKVYTPAGIMASIDVSASQSFTAGAANAIIVTKYYIKDAYVNIGENVTIAEVEAALADDLQNPTARQQAIQKAIGKMTQELNVYLYGVKVNNTNSSSTNLSGGVFQAYADAACTTPIGQPFTASNGLASFVGISGLDVVYVKQTKAPTGYQLYDQIIDLYPYADNTTQPASGHVKAVTTLGQDNYYTITVVNQAMGFLPFTGGTGTIIYTAIGLLIVLGAVFFIIVYKKKNKKEENK